METKAPEKSAKKSGRKAQKTAKSEQELKKLALETILELVKDDELKPAERLSAVKALLDYLSRQPEPEQDGALRVVFENLPDGFAD